MNRPTKSNLANSLKRDRQLREELIRVTNADEALSLNYRWEQKNGQERAYIELWWEKEQSIRLYYVKVTRNLSAVQQLVQEAARTVNRELAELLASQPPGASFQGYYLSGERREYCLGRIG